MDTGGYQLIPKRNLFCFKFVGFEEKKKPNMVVCEPGDDGGWVQLLVGFGILCRTEQVN